jgi:SAM-dependent methyltransferase
MPNIQADLAADQQKHWQNAYRSHPSMYGSQPSAPAIYAADLFESARAGRVLELGAGHGRDAIHFARRGFGVLATDFSAVAVEQLQRAAEANCVSEKVVAMVHDLREALPMATASIDAVYAHMALCMALSTKQIHTAVDEIRRVLRSRGTFIYTVRNTDDAHYGAGIARGDDVFEHGGFAVHFFNRKLVHSLAEGWTLKQIHDFHEGELPRRLSRVTVIRSAD